MTFGGEPLLYPDAVYAIMRAAKSANVPKRQLITNGYFTKPPHRMQEVARELAACGVNDLLLSVDAFHQETIPLETVRCFARAAKENGLPIRLAPAWLVSKTDDNPYNRETRRILESFADLEIFPGDGNIVFPQGNATRFLAEYFQETCPENPYVEDPLDVRCVSFSPNGDVLGGNVYRRDILKLLEDYTPDTMPT